MSTPTRFRWWMIDERTGKFRLTTYKLPRAAAPDRYPPTVRDAKAACERDPKWRSGHDKQWRSVLDRYRWWLAGDLVRLLARVLGALLAFLGALLALRVNETSRLRRIWRRGPESTRPTRICSPVQNRFATALASTLPSTTVDSMSSTSR